MEVRIHLPLRIPSALLQPDNGADLKPPKLMKSEICSTPCSLP